MSHYTMGSFGTEVSATLANNSTIWLESGSEIRPLSDFTGPGYRTIADGKAVTLIEKVVYPLDGDNVRLSSSVIGSFPHDIEVEVVGTGGRTEILPAGTACQITGVNAAGDGGMVAVVRAGPGSTWARPAPVTPVEPEPPVPPVPPTCPEGSILISDRCVPNIVVPPPTVDEDETPPAEAAAPWYKRTSTYLYAGGGILAITLLVLALRKKR